MSTEYAIQLKDVSMHFNMASERVENLKEYVVKALKHQLFFKDFTAVDHVSFEVKKGEVFGIVGTNGSGKSTLLKIISGILEPTSGKVITQGSIAPLIELGAGFDGNLTARENIFLNGAILGYSEEFLEERFQSIVDFAEIWDFLDMPIKNYSSGMVARIAFAIATVVKPDILIVDEILSVGDFLFQQKCENRIRELMEGGTTVLIVSHSIDQIRSLCSRVLWIEKSKPVMIGGTREVCDAYSNIHRTLDKEHSHEFQIVAEEQCQICGQKVSFRNEKGMTYHTEAYCSNCSTQLRTHDMAACFAAKVLGTPDTILGNYRDRLQDTEVLCCSQHSMLTVFFKEFARCHELEGTLSEWCDQLEAVSSIGIASESLDVITVENMLDLVNDPVRACRDLVRLLKPGGTILISVPIYEDRMTASTKKTHHRLYRDGVMIRTQWGIDAAEILKKAGIEMQMCEFHHWFAPEEQRDPDRDFDEFISMHPFYFYKFNSWVIWGVKPQS